MATSEFSRLPTKRRIHGTRPTGLEAGVHVESDTHTGYITCTRPTALGHPTLVLIVAYFYLSSTHACQVPTVPIRARVHQLRDGRSQRASRGDK